MKVVILAAGKSTRMKSRTPKVLHKLAGVPILRWVLDQAARLDPEEIIVVVGHESDRVREAFKDTPKISFVTQEPQLGTGHAVQQAAKSLEGFNGDVCVLCGDVPLLRPETLAQMKTEFQESEAVASVLTTKMEDAGAYGRIIRDGMGRLKQIIEFKDLPPEFADIKEVNTGTYMFNGPELLGQLRHLTNENAQNEYYLTDVIQLFGLELKLVLGTVCEDTEEVLGINNRKDLSVADGVARVRIMNDLMLNQGVTILDPANTYIEAGVKIGQDTTVYPNTAIRTGVEIGEDCSIGPFAHLRPGTKVGNGCKVGAFVETKNAIFGDGAKAGHMAYLGDVTMGEDVNIGAGSIVANYDGEKKHQTNIGDKAFIGCGTVLVAPVNVGKNAQTGANTVVPHNKDVPDDTIVVGIPAKELRKKG
ncbi:NTP transferase domain-containing protein [Planctomycetota bacterium]|nr:NTP transferase domain-containing protein [Planctomycetota bacterium]